ncbi:MAG TPA: hypothetical protein VGL59_04050 [Polyangia bacterium]|jgi:hypothetical protein
MTNGPSDQKASGGDDDLVRLPPFDAVELDLLALWGETRPTP